MSAGPGGALRLEHIGIAVPDLERAREEYARILGREPSPVEEVPGEKVRVSFFALDNCRIELLEPTAPDSPIQKFLDRKRSGIHHIALSVEGIERRLEDLRKADVPVVGEGLRRGSGGSLVLFLHPSAASGVLIEFSDGDARTSGERP